MDSFFSPGQAEDRSYRLFRDGEEKHHRKGREYLERVWSRCSKYVDDDSADKARYDFVAVYWELQLAFALCHFGKVLTLRQDLSYKHNEGPDLFAKHPNVWLECVVVRAGTGADALEYPQMMKVYEHDPDQVVLRLRSVIEVKSEKFRRYIDKGIVKSGDATVIAISGICLPYRWSGRIPPEIVRAVYPVGNPVIEINRETRKTVDSYIEYHDRVRKKSGIDIPTDIFLSDKFNHISAVLFGEADWVYPTIPPGHEFRVVHNLRATTPLPEGWLPVGHEYWWRDEMRLHSKDHNKNDGAAEVAD